MRRARNVRYRHAGRMVSVPIWKANNGHHYIDVRNRQHKPDERVYFGTRDFWSWVCYMQYQDIALGYGLTVL